MELRQLRLFVAAAEQLNIGRAARTIGISQPSLSTALYRLEKELGVSLFERHRGGVHLTAAGAHLLQHAHRIIAEADETVRAARQWGAAEAGILDLGFFTSLASGPLRTLLEQYRAAFPQVDVRLHEADSAQQLSWLRERRLDLAIIADTSPPPDLDMQALWQERAYAVLPAAHALAERTDLRWADLRGMTILVRGSPADRLFYNWVATRLGNGDTTARLQTQDISREAMLGLVAAGFGIGITSAASTAIVFPGIVFRPMAGPESLLQLAAAWVPSNPNPVLRRFLSFARVQLQRRGS